MRVEQLISQYGKSHHYRLIDSSSCEIKFATDFLKFLKVKNYSPNTIKNYAFDLKRYFTYLNSIKKTYDTITPNDIIEFLDYLRPLQKKANVIRLKPLSSTTIKRILAAVSSFYDWLTLINHLPQDAHPQPIIIQNKVFPVAYDYKSFLSFAKKQNQINARLIKIKLNKRLPRPISEKNFRKLLQSLATWRDKAILCLALQSGMRIGEILGLRFEDINFRKKEIWVRFREDNPNGVRVKGMRDRVICIEEPEALQLLNHYILYERPQSSSPYVFLSAKGRTYGKPLTYQGIYTVIEYHCRKLNIHKDVTLHVLRHAHATRMYEKGMGLLSLQKRLGHASPQTTQIYARVSDEKLKEEYFNAIKKRKG